jgi:hypothetical protein
MRKNTAVRLGAAITASALALSLGTSTATAEDAGTQTANLGMVKPDAGAAKTKLSTTKLLSKTQFGKASANAAARPSITADPADPDITSYNQKNIVLDQPGTWIYEGNPVVTNPEKVYVIESHLAVNGTDRGTRELAFDGANPPYTDIDTGEILSGLILPSNSPVGPARLGPAEIYTQTAPNTPDDLEPIIDPTLGGTFYIRRATGSTSVTKAPFQIYRSGGKIKFTANNWKIFQPSTGKYVGLGSIKLQYRHSNGTYSTLKTISLNSYGTGYYWRTDSTKRRYRLLISTTNTAQGSYSQTSPLI